MQNHINGLLTVLKNSKSNYSKADACNQLSSAYKKMMIYKKSLQYNFEELKYIPGNDMQQKMLIYNNISENYRRLKKFNRGLKYAAMFLDYAESQKDSQILQRAQNVLGLIYQDKAEHVLDKNSNYIDDDIFLGLIDMSIHYLNQSLHTANILIQKFEKDQKLQQNNQQANKILEDLQKTVIEAQYNIANSFYIKGRWDSEFYENSITQLHDVAILANNFDSHDFRIIQGKCYNTLGLIYIQKRLFVDAQKCYEKDLQICESEKDIEGLIHTLRSLGTVFQNLFDYEKAQQQFDKAFKLAQVNKMEESQKITQEYIEILEYNKQKMKVIKQQLIELQKLNVNKDYEAYFQKILHLCRNYEELEVFEKCFKLAQESLDKLKLLEESRQQQLNQDKMETIELLLKLYIAFNLKKNKNLQEAKTAFEQLISILEDKIQRQQQKQDNNPGQLIKQQFFDERDWKDHLMESIIEYGNLLEDLKAPQEDIEKQYQRSYQMAIQHNNLFIQSVCLCNLDIFYQTSKQPENLKEIKKKRAELQLIYQDKDGQDQQQNENSTSDSDSDSESNDQWKDNGVSSQDSDEDVSNHQDDAIDIEYANNSQESQQMIEEKQEKQKKHHSSEKSTMNSQQSKFKKKQLNNESNKIIYQKKTQPQGNTQQKILKQNNQINNIAGNKLNNNQSYNYQKIKVIKDPLQQYKKKCQKYIIQENQHISDAFKTRYNFLISHLFLDDQNLYPAIRSLKHFSLVQLDLSYNFMTNKTLETLIIVLPQNCNLTLEKINFAYTGLQYSIILLKFIEKLGEFRVFHEINLSGIELPNVFQDQAAFWDALSKLKTIKSIIMKECKLKTCNLKFKQCWPELEQLNLKCNAIDVLKLLKCCMGQPLKLLNVSDQKMQENYFSNMQEEELNPQTSQTKRKKKILLFEEDELDELQLSNNEIEIEQENCNQVQYVNSQQNEALFIIEQLKIKNINTNFDQDALNQVKFSEYFLQLKLLDLSCLEKKENQQKYIFNFIEYLSDSYILKIMEYIIPYPQMSQLIIKGLDLDSDNNFEKFVKFLNILKNLIVLDISSSIISHIKIEKLIDFLNLNNPQLKQLTLCNISSIQYQDKNQLQKLFEDDQCIIVV